MGWLTSLIKIVKPLVKSIPIVGAAFGVYEVGKMLTGPDKKGALVPTMPQIPGMPGGLSVAPGTTGGPGLLPRGPGGRLQLPWQDPAIAEHLKKWAIDDAYLKQYVRAPKGYVVVRDQQGRPFGVLQKVAQFYGLWKPAKKPPI